MSLAESKQLISTTQSTCEIIEQNYNPKYTEIYEVHEVSDFWLKRNLNTTQST